MSGGSGHNDSVPGHVRVKICGITRPEDGRMVEAAGAQAIGINFAPRSKRRVSPSVAAEILAVVGPLVTVVGVFVDAPLEELLATVRRLRLGAVQLHGDEPPAYAAAVRSEVPVIRALPFVRAMTPESLADYPADAFMLDAPVPGSGEAFDWSQAGAWKGHPRLILAGGITPETVARGVRALRPYAVDVASGVESAPGLKDPERVAAFVRAAQGA
jgi:phosphoribosylanthranilate isomerase